MTMFMGGWVQTKIMAQFNRIFQIKHCITEKTVGVVPYTVEILQTTTMIFYICVYI